MNSQRYNSVLLVKFLFALVICATVLTLLIQGMSNSAGVRLSFTQDEEKSLGIWRFANEPVELIDLKIDQKSVKRDVKLKSKDPGSRLEQYKVVFKGDENWFKKIRITLRNVSGRPIYSLRATLVFLPSGTHVGFKLPLKTELRNLKTHPLAPGEELELAVKDSAFEETVATMIRHGFSIKDMPVSFSVEHALFSDDFGWSKGKFIKRNAGDPRRWDAVDDAPPEASRFERPAGFKLVSFTRTSSIQQNYYQCQQQLQNWMGIPNCPNSAQCYIWNAVGNQQPGILSWRDFPGHCKFQPTDEEDCSSEQVFYADLVPDESCATPSPTPTPGCAGPGEYIQFGRPCCPGLTPNESDICTSPLPTPTPDLCAFIAPPTCPPGQMWIRGTYPFCYTCITNPFPSFSPTPTPTCAGFLQGCFVTPCCPPYVCNGISCELPTPTPELMESGEFVCRDGDDNDGDLFIDCADSDCAHYCTNGCTPSQWTICMAVGSAGCLDGNCYTPILIDPLGDGFSLSSAGNGVVFNLIPGLPVKIAWTTPDSDDAWLVLDRNRNGLIDSGHELFGNSTSQPQPPPGVEKNGFRALAEFDKAVNGGNGDGAIDEDDSVFSLLRLWQDTNHNGISEPEELHLLTEFGLESIALDYRDGRRRDRHGNVFRYRAKVYGPKHNDLGRWAYDVLLRMEPLKPSDGGNRLARAYTDGGNNILRLLGIEFGYDLTTRSWIRRAEDP